MASHEEYRSPAQLLHDASLNSEKKVQILEQLCEDKKALMRASYEGMIGDDRPDLLREIEIALSALRGRPRR